jgi:hypothetical protein
MLSFITYKEVPEQIEIVADDQGIDQLIAYLAGTKAQKDHMHLIIDSEIDRYPIAADRKGIVFSVKQVRLEYADTAQWSK